MSLRIIAPLASIFLLAAIAVVAPGPHANVPAILAAYAVAALMQIWAHDASRRMMRGTDDVATLVGDEFRVARAPTDREIDGQTAGLAALYAPVLLVAFLMPRSPAPDFALMTFGAQVFLSLHALLVVVESRGMLGDFAAACRKHAAEFDRYALSGGPRDNGPLYVANVFESYRILSPILVDAARKPRAKSPWISAPHLLSRGLDKDDTVH